PENIRNLLLYVLNRSLEIEVAFDPVTLMPSDGIYDRRTGRIWPDFDEFAASDPEYADGDPWTAVVFSGSYLRSGQMGHINAIIDALEARDLNVVAMFGYPEADYLEKYLVRPDGNSRVDAIVGMAFR